ncbi:unnamed protein product, partial [Meganyctiphanes norvegica]
MANNSNSNNTSVNSDNFANLSSVGMNNINNSMPATANTHQSFVRSTPSRKSAISLSSFRKSSNSVSFSDDAAPGQPPKTSPIHRKVLPSFNGRATSFSSRTRKTSHVSFSDSGTGGKTSNNSSIHFPRVITESSFPPRRKSAPNSISVSDSSESHNNTSGVTSIRRFSCISPSSPDVNNRGDQEANCAINNVSSYRKLLNESSSNGGHSPDSNINSKHLKLIVPQARSYNRSLSSPCSSSPTSSPGKRSPPLFNSNDQEVHHNHHHHHRVKKKSSKWKRLLKGKKDKKVSPEAII